MSHRRSSDVNVRVRRAAAFALAIAGSLESVAAATATATAAGSGVQPFDAAAPPVRIGQTLAELLSSWGERATFGADCGSWRGPSVDQDVAWRGEALRIMALLRGDRVAALRFEQTLDGVPGLAQCAAGLDAFQRKWLVAAGIDAGAAHEAAYDGPVIRATRAAAKAGLAIGTFEGDYRESRAQCRVALVVTQPLLKPP